MTSKTFERMATARQLRWGQMVTGIELARSALLVARRAIDLLKPADRKALEDAYLMLAGVEQRAWSAQSRDLDDPSRRIRKRVK